MKRALELYKELRGKALSTENLENTVFYISDTEKLRTVKELRNIIKKVKEDNEMDFEIGVLKEETFQKETEIINCIEKSLNFMTNN